MKTFFKYFLGATLLVLAACSRLGDERVDIDNFIGTWQEYYDDPLFVMDGSCSWTILRNEIHLHVYDALSNGSHDHTIGYTLEKNGGKYTITLAYPEELGHLDASFEIVKLTDREMAWQKVGTTFSRGSYSVDYLHFVNDRYW